MAESTTASTNEDEPQLQPQLSEFWAISTWQLLFLFLICVFFLVATYMPLRGTDLWLHVNYGRWMAENRALPQSEPFLGLAEGMPVVNSAWLSQLIFAGCHQLGDEWLSGLFAVTSCCSLCFLMRLFFLQSHSMLATLIASTSVILVGWSRIATIRPEIFAGLCLAVLLWLVVPRALPRQGETQRSFKGAWIGVPITMLFWANLHGSFTCGIAVLGCLCLGRGVDVAWQRRSILAPPGDALFRKLIVLTELGFLATLINPHGLDLWWYVVAFSNNANLLTILEWQPLTFTGVAGREFAASWLLLLVLARYSRRPVCAAEVLTLLLFGALTAKHVRMIGWYAPLFGLVVTRHASGLLPKGATPDETYNGPRFLHVRSRHLLLVGGLFLWMTFSFSPVSRPVLGGPRRLPQQIHDRMTPLALAEFLRDNPVRGQTYNPQYWGDWLVTSVSEHTRVFATSNIHMLPRTVWSDYQRIQSAGDDWQDLLDRYRVQTVVVDRERMRRLNRVLRRSAQWRRVYRDDQALVYIRAKGDTGSGSSARPADQPND